MFYRIALLLAAAGLLASLGSCSQRSEKEKNYSENRLQMERSAQAMLAEARAHLAASRTDSAAAVVQRMRKQCYLALDARREGILRMDSIDLLRARQSLALTDSLLRAGDSTATTADFEEACAKVHFYERKIKHDKSQP